ncbi:MAG: DUF3990 domain-containing protein [Candidatus Fibromonas sp.]|jgi:hypothetical protein|nr:DUF3990 domain-containing protein [Candidatus Fibromonas sp.]
MNLYHGSIVEVKNPRIIARKNRGLDFGYGFYTTTNEEQAVNFTKSVMKRTGIATRNVSVYEFDCDKAKLELDILQFKEPDLEWLEFVRQNRFSIYSGNIYDLVIGPVANDDVFPTLQAYLEGIIPAEAAIAGLKIKKLYNQYCFLTERSLTFLKFVNSFEAKD